MRCAFRSGGCEAGECVEEVGLALWSWAVGCESGWEGRDVSCWVGFTQSVVEIEDIFGCAGEREVVCGIFDVETVRVLVIWRFGDADGPRAVVQSHWGPR